MRRTLVTIFGTVVVVMGILLVLRLVQPDTAVGESYHSTACQLQIDDAAKAPQRVGSGEGSAVLIGDSWATMEGIYPRELADRLDVELQMAAVGGTGYVNGGACGGRAFISRVYQIPKDADLVILAGGVNDGGAPKDMMSKAVAQTIAAARSRAPGVKVVVVGVPRVPLLEDDVTGAVDEVLAASDADLFVDVRGWDISTLPDGIHPDAGGAREYGRLLAQAIQSAG